MAEGCCAPVLAMAPSSAAMGAPRHHAGRRAARNWSVRISDRMTSFSRRGKQRRSGPWCRRERRRERRTALYRFEGDARTIATHAEPQGEANEIDGGAKRSVGQGPGERQAAQRAIGQLDVHVVPPPEGTEDVDERRISEDQPAFEPGEVGAQRDVATKRGLPVGVQATQVARSESSDTTHGDGALAHNNLHRGIFRIFSY